MDKTERLPDVAVDVPKILNMPAEPGAKPVAPKSACSGAVPGDPDDPAVMLNVRAADVASAADATPS